MSIKNKFSAVSQYSFKKAITSFFFLSLFLLGTAIYRDYGISWDEPEQRLSGLVSLKYIGEYFDIQSIKKSEALAEYREFNLNTYRDRAFGVAFETPLVALERLFRLSDERDIYFFRHYVNFLVFLLGVYAVFRLSERRFQSWKIALLTSSILTLTPRIFAESFYNSKDLIFLSVFAIATNAAVNFLLRPSIANTFLLGLSTAIAIDVRSMAIILPMYVLTFLTLRVIKREIIFKRACAFGSLYLFFCWVGIITFWPWLWSAPWAHFTEAISAFSRWVRSDIYMLYYGQIIRSLDLPWHYVPTWIAITTPPLYSLFWVVGVIGIFKKILSIKIKLWVNDEEFQDVLFSALFFGPILAIILLHSVVYDGWRHLYFIYPAFLLISTKGFLDVWHFSHKIPWRRYVFIGAVVASTASTAFWMWNAHPYQNVYFNSIVGSNWKEKFDLDYWGLSNRRALELIVSNDARPLIKVRAGSSTPLYHSLKVLGPIDRNRIEVVVDEYQADYIVLNYRGKTVDDKFLNDYFQLQEVILVNQEPILELWRRRSQ
jgi:hypothetical protein